MSIAEKLSTIANNVQEVYDAGKTTQSEEFWQNYQKYYQVNYCKYRYAGKGWNINTFYPQHNMKPTTTHGMFQEFGNMLEPFSLVERLEECGVTFDFSNCTSASYTFYSVPFTDIPHLDTRKLSVLQYIFQGSSNIKTISLALKDDGSQTWTSTFNSCPAIENLTITSGAIGQNGFNVKWATKLSKASLLSILNACNVEVIGKGISITLPSKCIDGTTDTEALMSETGDAELYGALMCARSYGYNITFA